MQRNTPGEYAGLSGICHNECLVEPDTVCGTGGIGQDNPGREIPE